MWNRAKFLSALFFVYPLLLSTGTLSHPLKISASLIDYDPQDKTLRLECKVFLDDFERSLSRSVLQGVDVSTLKKEERPRIIESYFKEFYQIRLNGKKLPLKYQTVVPLYDRNVLIIKFAKISLPIKKGDTLEIENSMFFRDYGPSQSNRIAVRIPPFGIEEGQVATWNNFKFSYTFGKPNQ